MNMKYHVGKLDCLPLLGWGWGGVIHVVLTTIYSIYIFEITCIPM